MSSLHPTPEELEALTLGRVAATSRASIEAHVATCDECRDEVEWLRTEQNLFRKRRSAVAAAPAYEAVVKTVAANGAKKQRRRSFWFAVTGVVPAAAALSAALLLPPPVRHATVKGPRERDPLVAITAAEKEVGDAARILEEKYRKRASVLGRAGALAKLDALTEARTQVLAARAAAGGDLEARQVALEGYTEYVQELHRLVADLDSVSTQ